MRSRQAATIYPVQLAGFVLAVAASSHPRLRYRLVPRVLQHDRAHVTAMRQFWAQSLHQTPSRTGVLIFAAQAERYATVIADEVIHREVAPDVWRGAVDALTAAIRDGCPADGFVAAIEQCGAVLAEHFPRPVRRAATSCRTSWWRFDLEVRVLRRVG